MATLSTAVESLSCVWLCHPMDYSPLGSSVHWIFQMKILEWVAISFSEDPPDRGIEPRSPALQADTLSSELPGKPNPEPKDENNSNVHWLLNGFKKKPLHKCTGILLFLKKEGNTDTYHKWRHMLSEISQVQKKKGKYGMIPRIWSTSNSPNHSQKNRMVAVEG